MAKQDTGSLPIISRPEAIAQGLRWYFTGEPCGHGHMAKRSVSNFYCRDCVEMRRRVKRAEDPAPFRARDAARLAKNREKRCAQRRASDAANPAMVRARRRRDYDRNKEKIKARVVAWQKKNPGRMMYWVQLRRERTRRATPKWLTREHRQEIKNLYIKAAAITSETGVPHEVDHIVPLTGRHVCGLHVPWNLQILTAKANREKNNRHEP